MFWRALVLMVAGFQPAQDLALPALYLSENMFGSPESCDPVTRARLVELPVMTDTALVLWEDTFMAQGFLCTTTDLQRSASGVSANVICLARGPGFRGTLQVVEQADHSSAHVRLSSTANPKSGKPAKTIGEWDLARCPEQ